MNSLGNKTTRNQSYLVKPRLKILFTAIKYLYLEVYLVAVQINSLLP